MKSGSIVLILSVCLISPPAFLDAKEYVIENTNIGRVLVLENGTLRTKVILNKQAGTEAIPTACDEFRLRISSGTHTENTDILLTARDFKSDRPEKYTLENHQSVTGLSFELKNKQHDLTIKVCYELGKDDFYMRKHIQITSGRPVTLERIDIDSITFNDAFQPYTVSAIYARGKWSPGLGQPLYTTRSATFWGTEFPASYNYVDNTHIYSGYLWGREIKANETYRSYNSVVGVSDNPEFNQDAFFKYIDEIRVRPFRLQIQYNTWFNAGRGVNRDIFTNSVALINKQLCLERKNMPLKAYVIDDGWQDCAKDTEWTDKTWKVNDKFENNFADSIKAVKAANSQLGLWMSPGCLFGSSSMVAKYRAAGFEALDDWMSLAGPKYMQLLEDRMVELTKQGVGYFKLDGLFGHLNLRNFELHGEKYGIPYMPQLGVKSIKSGDQTLNDSKYDELKTYYLTAGTERLMQIFSKMAEANPEVYIVISNGAYLSPWWLMYIDSIWMINAGDAAGGSSRTAELVYRDERYHEIWIRENTQFPMHAIFNHEPKKTKTGEPTDVFRKYLYMNLSRGTGFIELYIKPAVLKDYDWDVISEGLHWTYEVFPTFKRSRMHGGNPKADEVYGYTGWSESQGYVSMHNPSGKKKSYSFKLDRAFGLMPGSKEYYLSSPMEDSLMGLKNKYSTGDIVTVELEPEQIIILNFTISEKEWPIQKYLQKHAEDTRVAVPEESALTALVTIEKHPVLGVWTYQYAGSTYTREFTRDGFCILKQGDDEIWKKNFNIANDKRILVGNLPHILTDNNTMSIEGRYTAKRAK